MGETRVPDPPPPTGKSQALKGFLRNTGTDPPREQLDPLGPIASRGGFLQPSVKYLYD